MSVAAVDDRGHDAGKGREADSPREVPAKGWKEILMRTYGEINDDRVMLIAAGVTYYLLLALFPALAAFVSIYGLFTDPATVSEHVNVLSSVVPAGGMTIIEEQLTRLTSNGGTALGFALIFSLAIALWSASSGVKSLFEAMNIAYDERESRNFLKLNATALLFTFAGVIAAGVMIAVAVLIPAMLSVLGLNEGLEWLVQILGFVVLALVLGTGIAALYRFGPSRQHAKWRWITPGAILSVVVIIIVSILFSWYAANFANYDATYGSLGALIGLLTWMWISVTVVIIGAELNSEAEHQTAKDSTVGADDPMGQRHATMADTVAGEPGEEGRPGKPGEGLRDKSPEWYAGYKAATQQLRPKRRMSIGALAFAVPAALAAQALRGRERK